MTDYVQKIRVRQVDEPRVRVRVLPRIPPLEIELQNTGTVVQWRLGTAGTWVDLIDIDDIDASVTIGTVTTLAPGASATVTNVGTPQNVILDFGLPAGFDGQVVDITAGQGIAVDSTDPAHPIITVDAIASEIPFTPAGTIAATNVQAAIEEVEAEKQPIDADLTAIAALTTTAFGRAVLALANAGALATYAGVGTGDSPQFAAVNIGNASDTTLSRSSAGRLAVEGVNLALDETGTFVPGLLATGSTFSYQTQVGQYSYNGSRVVGELDIILNTSGNTLTANPLFITGLPYTVGGSFNIGSPIIWANATTAYVNVAGIATIGGTQIALNGATAAATSLNTALNANAILHATNASRLRLNFSYKV